MIPQTEYPAGCNWLLINRAQVALPSTEMISARREQRADFIPVVEAFDQRRSAWREAQFPDRRIACNFIARAFHR